MKTLTNTGDDGTTSLYSGKRIKKNHPAMEAIGTLEECSCHLGLALAQYPLEEELDLLRDQLLHIQKTLFDIGDHVADLPVNPEKTIQSRFDNEGTKQLERWIKQMNGRIHKNKNFILPGGDISGAFLHLARSVCRRAERMMIPLFEKEKISPESLTYLNRLSDYLFVAARYINYFTHTPEKKY